MIYEVVRFGYARFDEDGFCTDNGRRGAVLFAVPAAYPGALDRNAIRARIEAMGVRLEPGFASLTEVTMSFAVVGGGHVAVTTTERNP